MSKKNLRFIRCETLEEEIYSVINDKNQFLAEIKKVRTGSYMHWNLCWTKDDRYEDGEMIHLSAGCIDEIREFIKNPYKFIENYQPTQKEKGAICCKCGDIYLEKDYTDNYNRASNCCNGEYEEGYLQLDGKTFISN